MKSEDIIRMAREAGYGWASADIHLPALERFAALVAAHEREACAKVAEGYWRWQYADEAVCQMAAEIRARNNA